jgi:uncharacterized protein (UPF0262 family)
LADHPHRIVKVTLAEDGIVRYNPDVEKERTVAVYDLLDDNHFRLTDGAPGPYEVRLAIRDNQLVFDIHCAEGGGERCVALPLTPFRKIVKDYFTVCESYYQAIRTASPSRIEAIDMGRRGLHNEGSQQLRDRLAASVEVDVNTARRLFTLLCVLHLRA